MKPEQRLELIAAIDAEIARLEIHPNQATAYDQARACIDQCMGLQGQMPAEDYEPIRQAFDRLIAILTAQHDGTWRANANTSRHQWTGR